jgi:hypothetical protein
MHRLKIEYAMAQDSTMTPVPLANHWRPGAR